MSFYQANDQYVAQIRKAWIHDPAETTFQVNALPTNFPTILTINKATDEEAVFSVTGCSGATPSEYVLTGVTWMRGYDGDQELDSPLTCLNNEEYINQFTGVTVPVGGTTGQVLKKKSNTNYDTEFGDLVAVSVTTKGDLQTYSNAPAKLGVGTNGQILESRSTETTGLKWIDSPGSNSFVINEVPSGLVNSSNKAYDTAHAYVAGSIQVYRDGQLMTKDGDYVETDSNTVTFTSAPVTGTVVLVSYQQTVNTSGNADTLDGQHLTGIIGLIYPVGSIYISVVSTNPGTLFGVGTWVAFGSGKTLVGINAAETEFDTVEETGGEKTHTLIVDEMPAHTHSGARVSVNATSPNSNIANDSSATSDWATTSTGGGLAHNNLQPYIVTYMFKRTA